MRKLSPESSEKLLSVDESGPLKLIGQFSRDVIGCKARVKSVNSKWQCLTPAERSFSKKLIFL